MHVSLSSEGKFGNKVEEISEVDTSDFKRFSLKRNKIIMHKKI